MRYSLCLLLLLCSFYSGLSQGVPLGEGKIKGKVVDSATNEPIGYASVTVLVTGSINVAGGMITDDNGAFTIDNLAPGEYKLRIDFMGYDTRTVTGITLAEKHMIQNVGTLNIKSNSKALQDATITGARNFMDNKLDKFVYNVEKDVTSQGGVATDVLKKIPQVAVDVDGNVELLGNGNVRIFINGKPSSMMDNNLADALQSIPAGQIKSIEVITSPGAQYDAQGTGGIINIILKDNKARGVNGNVAASAGTRLENASGNIHIKDGNVDITASMLGNWQLKGNTLSSLYRATDSTQLKQSGTGTYERIGLLPQIGLEWAIDSTSNLTTAATYSYLSQPGSSSLSQDNIGLYPYTDTQSVKTGSSTSLFRSLDANISYRKKFYKEGQELDLSYQFNYGTGAVAYNEHFTNGNTITSGGNGNDHWDDKETYINADYAHPLKKDVIINVGVKGTFSRINDNSDHYTLDPSTALYNFDPSQINDFIYKRDIYAAYVSLTFPLWKVYQLKLGLRDEQTVMNFPGDTLFYHPAYNFLAPSFVISRKLSDNQSIKLSYSKRLQRPGFRSLNPFIDASDPANLIQGNPTLRPEKVDNVELSYYRYFDKGSSLLITLYEKYQQDDNQTYIQYHNALEVGDTTYRDVSVITTINASIEQMAGINISGNLAISKKFELRGSVILFDKYIISHFDSTTTNSLNYRINGNAYYQFSSTLVAEVFYSFNSPRTEIQGKFPAYTNYSFAIRKMFLDKKLSIALTTTNPFNRYTDQYTAINGTTFAETIDRKVPNQSFGISASYKFGKMEYKEKKQETSGDEGG